MMAAKKMMTALNEQINKEMYSSYLYLAMSAWFEDQNLKGFAHWMKLQAQEETSHAMKLFDYIIERGGSVTLKAIEEPPSDFGSPLKAFEATLEHEKFITASINDLVTLARKESDYATEGFLGWYVAEQVEEEANASEIVATLKMIGDASVPLIMMDRQLGQRGG